MKFGSMTMAYARLAMREAVRRNLFDPNVRMVSIGMPEKEGRIVEDELSIRYHVREKYSRLRLESAIEAGATNSDLARPIQVGRFSFQTDVVEGKYRPSLRGWGSWRPPQPTDPRARRAETLRGGVSISDEFHRAYGTLGCKVLDRATGAEMILSNWHVLGVEWSARPGQRIYQPGRRDGGTFADTVATLTRDAMSANIDAAVATLNGDRPLLNDQLDIGAVTGVSRAQIDMAVIKSGRASGITRGRVTDVDGIARIEYWTSTGLTERLILNVVTIEPQNAFQEVSRAGDSGSLWLDADTNRAIGLHFAGDDRPERGLSIDMVAVLDALKVDLAVDRPVRPRAVPGFRAPSAASANSERSAAEKELVLR